MVCKYSRNTMNTLHILNFHFRPIFTVYRFVNALVYYGVFLSAPVIGGSFYLNFFLTSLVELPAIPAGVWIFNRLVVSLMVENVTSNNLNSHLYIERFVFLL